MGGPEKVLPFARLFLIPGAGHGNGGVVGLDETIIRWVEEGVAPDKLINHEPNGRTRPVFPYPEAAKYDGSGSAGQIEDLGSSRPER